MAKISKQQTALHQQALDLIHSDRPLRWEERAFICDNYHPMANHNVGQYAIFFTPGEIAQSLACDGPSSGTLIDLCSGIGTLAFHCAYRAQYERTPLEIACVEQQPEFVLVGKRLLPEARWYQGSVFSLALLRQVWTDNGSQRFHNAISNPPFGRLPGPEGQGDWLSYQGDVELMVAELALRIAEDYAIMILPPKSCTFSYSWGHQGEKGKYERFPWLKPERYSLELEKFLAIHPDVRMAPSNFTVETDKWQGTRVKVELAHVYREGVR